MISLGACTLNAEPNYSVTIPLGADNDNMMAYLIDWDSSRKVDSVLVSNGVAAFKGHVDAPFIGRLIVGGERGPIFMVEQGDIVLSEDMTPSGTPLNEKMESYNRRRAEISAEFRTLDWNDSIQATRGHALEQEYMQIPAKAYSENKGNLVGLYWLLQDLYEMDLDVAKLDAMIAADASLKESKRVESFRNSLIAKETTNVGKHYKDFTISYNGKDEKLSDYVKPGQFTLVDFWASWCGPCIRQTKVIKELYNKYKDKGLEVVGVAVWDEPENTLRAIKSHSLPWPCIIDAQTVPTDLYGISSIPCILLINPEGVIVSRDKQGDQLIEEVSREMDRFIEAEAKRAAGSNDAESDTALIF